MPWFKVDDHLYSHPKWVGASPAAKALWVTAGSWCAAQLTDGHVPRHMLPVVGGRPRVAQELVDTGLWIENGTGWYFHDWFEYQPAKADTEAVREKESKYGKRGNHLRWHVSKGIKNPECPFCQEGDE